MTDKLKKFVQEIAEQTPEKPDYWSSCGQCERNASKAEELLEEIGTEPAGSAEPSNLPPLPFSPYMRIDWASKQGSTTLYTEDQMRDYARAAMSTQSTHTENVSKSAGGNRLERCGDSRDCEAMRKGESTLHTD